MTSACRSLVALRLPARLSPRWGPAGEWLASGFLPKRHRVIKNADSQLSGHTQLVKYEFLRERKERERVSEASELRTKSVRLNDLGCNKNETMVAVVVAISVGA